MFLLLIEQGMASKATDETGFPVNIFVTISFFAIHDSSLESLRGLIHSSFKQPIFLLKQNASLLFIFRPVSFVL